MSVYLEQLGASDPKSVVLHSPESVILFWFGSLTPSELEPLSYIETMMGVWFAGKCPQFDEIQKENAELLKRVSASDALGEEWTTPIGYLARVILLDQFSRCIYRASPEAFQYDTLTASLVKDIVERGWFTAPGVFVPIQRFFLGVAIQHSEDIVAQRLGVKLANEVAAGAGEDIQNWVTNLHGYPMQHHDVIAQFGRFPGRNDALGRETTSEEELWLSSPECPSWAKSQQKKS